MSSDEEIIQEIIAALKNDPTNQHLISTLAGIGEKTVPFLEELMNETNAVLQMAVLKIAGKVGRVCLPFIVKELQNNDEWVRLAAVRTLGRMGKDAEDAFPELVNLLDDKDSFVRDKVFWILEQMQPATKDIVPVLISLLNNDDIFIRKNSFDLLEALFSDDFSPYINEIIFGLIPYIQDLLLLSSRVKVDWFDYEKDFLEFWVEINATFSFLRILGYSQTNMFLPKFCNMVLITTKSWFKTLFCLLSEDFDEKNISFCLKRVVINLHDKKEKDRLKEEIIHLSKERTDTQYYEIIQEVLEVISNE